MILIDPPVWPAHGTHFAHLVSDTSLDELHAFAAANGVPHRAFDHDHYDVPERRVDDLIAAGAVAVRATELVRRIVAAGLRVRTSERTPKRSLVLPGLNYRWDTLMPEARPLGEDLLARWQEPHRRYHDVRHLSHVLESLELLVAEDVHRPLALAAWFHDAIHDGVTPDDEEASALLAEGELPAAGLSDAEAAEVGRLVRVTITHDPDPADDLGALLVDADLAVLGLPRARYHVYARDVRAEYAHVADEEFRVGRITVLEALSAAPLLYRTPRGQELWEDTARQNVAEELDRLRKG